ncbi:MAG: SDR family oxidoreductase, partial [Anaerolineae bacterium]|nr:SDR family oxidoreductase [Anaerolineae bacterium]
QAIDLRGKIALVTGSARRVGKAIALELAAHGMTLVIHHGSSPEDAAATVAEIQAAGGEAVAHQADLRDPDAIRAMFDAVRAHFGRLDVLVNSAASFQRASILDVTLDEWRSVLDVNLTAPFLCSQYAAPLLREARGSIVNILDLSAFRPWKAFPVHSVSKAGLKMLTETLALSLGPEVRVNAVAPGPVLRDEGNSPERWAQIGARLPVGRTGDPADVARAVAFLAAQPFITGEVLRVDGGEALLG